MRRVSRRRLTSWQLNGSAEQYPYVLVFIVEIATITYNEETNMTIGHILTHKELDTLLEKCGVAKKPEEATSGQ